MKKTIFIIPGFGHKATDKWHKWMISFFKKKGFAVKSVPIHWKYRVMSDHVEEFKKYYNKHKSEKNYVLGFSFGAMIALITSEELNPQKIFLCSLSPYFRENLKSMNTKWADWTGKRRLLDLNKFSAKRIAKKLNIHTTIFYGEAEGKKYPDVRERAEQAHKDISKSKLIIVKNAPHLINHPNYIKAIKKQFK